LREQSGAGPFPGCASAVADDTAEAIKRQNVLPVLVARNKLLKAVCYLRPNEAGLVEAVKSRGNKRSVEIPFILGAARPDERGQLGPKSTLRGCSSATFPEAPVKIRRRGTTDRPIDETAQRPLTGLSRILDNVTVSVAIGSKSWRLSGLPSAVEDVAEIPVRSGSAHRDRGLHLKTKRSPAVGVSKLDDQVIHRLAVACLLDGCAADSAALKHRPLPTEKSGQIIGDDLVFIGEASATGEFGGCGLFFLQRSLLWRPFFLCRFRQTCLCSNQLSSESEMRGPRPTSHPNSSLASHEQEGNGSAAPLGAHGEVRPGRNLDAASVGSDVRSFTREYEQRAVR
jgi:hypothetical protein